MIFVSANGYFSLLLRIFIKVIFEYLPIFEFFCSLSTLAIVVAQLALKKCAIEDT